MHVRPPRRKAAVTEEKRGPGRPVTTGTTPKRDVRVGPLWDQARALAKARGETMRQVIERSLRHYVHRYSVSRQDDTDQDDGLPPSAA